MSIFSTFTFEFGELKGYLAEHLTAMCEYDQALRPFVIVSDAAGRFVQFCSKVNEDKSVVVLFDIPNQGFDDLIIGELEKLGFTREPLDADVKWTWQKTTDVANAVIDTQAILFGLVGLGDADTVRVEFGTTDLPPPATN